MPGDDDILDDLARGYQPLTDAQLERVWAEGHVIVDTNILLDVYRYSAATREKLLHLFGRFEERLWIPHQAAEEYFRNRLKVLIREQSTQDKVRSRLDETREGLGKALEDVQRATGRREGISEMHGLVRAKFEELREALVSSEEERLAGTESWRDDAIHEELLKLIAGKVGSPFDEEEMKRLRTEAERRYEKQVPPGYLDADKPVPEKYGDFILWKQTLDHADTHQKPVILVSDEDKDDWVWRESGKTIGPRPELARELYDTAKVEMVLVNAPRFMERAAQVLGEDVSDEVLSELAEVEQARQHPGTSRLTKEIVESVWQPAFEEALRKSSTNPRTWAPPDAREGDSRAQVSHVFREVGHVGLALTTFGLDIQAIRCVVTSQETGVGDEAVLVVNTGGGPYRTVFEFPHDFHHLKGVEGRFRVDWYAELWREGRTPQTHLLATDWFDTS